MALTPLLHTGESFCFSYLHTLLFLRIIFSHMTYPSFLEFIERIGELSVYEYSVNVSNVPRMSMYCSWLTKL